jgi:hypothetical protein
LTLLHRECTFAPKLDSGSAASADGNRRVEMYIGIGTVVVIILILILLRVFGIF